MLKVILEWVPAIFSKMVVNEMNWQRCAYWYNMQHKNVRGCHKCQIPSWPMKKRRDWKNSFSNTNNKIRKAYLKSKKYREIARKTKNTLFPDEKNLKVTKLNNAIGLKAIWLSKQ